MRLFVKALPCSSLFIVICTHAALLCNAQPAQKPLWQNKEFSVYADSVVQQKFTGKVLSSTEITSNYKSPANEYLSPAISFKFSINGKDNEMKPGNDHHFVVAGEGLNETPLIQFGSLYSGGKAVPDNAYLKPNTALKIRLDLRNVLQELEQKGFYTTFRGEKIYKDDFKAVYVAGGTAPLSWDFDNLVNKPELKLNDEDGDGIYETTLVLNSPKDEKETASVWRQTKSTEAFPQYTSGYPVSDAAYNLAVEEMINAVEPDSTFRTGKEWAGVWTRDISYSIILSMAYLQPQVSKYSLMRKVKGGKIVQDTGTGGAYPASTDRIVWALAAWELYKATGDEDWLKQAYGIVKATMEDDLKNAYDKQTGLFKGESSFLDWREQTYPKWMQPVDIFESECLGTNAVFYEANNILSKMATLLKDYQSAEKYKKIAAGVKEGINKYLWMPEKGYYGQYLYGRTFKALSPRAEALGESLAVLFGIADGAKGAQVIRNAPLMDFGVPCIYPQIPNLPPYHNNAVWPFVQSYFALAAASAGNEAAVMQSIAAVYRPAVLWATNKENFVASNGDFAGTQINSSNMLWSLSGNLALVHKVLFGIRFNENSLSFQPFVPQALQGVRSLKNFTYRNAVLDIELEGWGNQIKSFMLDGKPATSGIAGSLRGRHAVKIVLANKTAGDQKVNNVAHYVTLDAPTVTFANNMLSWNGIPGAKEYKVLKNGKEMAKSQNTALRITGNDAYAEYQVIAVDTIGILSFASEPIAVSGKEVNIYEIEQSAPRSALPHRGFSGEGFVETSLKEGRSITVPVVIPEDGVYAIDVRYANGSGPINTENKCAIRALKASNTLLGTLVMPQRGREEWSNWGWSNAVLSAFKKGTYNLVISYEPHNENMNGEINQALLDYLRVSKIK